MDGHLRLVSKWMYLNLEEVNGKYVLPLAWDN